MRHDPAGASIVIMLRSLKLHGMAHAVDDLLARAFACSSCLSHVPLLSGYDEPRTLSYQITLFGPISADVRQELQQFYVLHSYSPRGL